MAPHLPSCALQQWCCASFVGPGFFLVSLCYSAAHIAPSGCLISASPSPLSRSDLQILSLIVQPLPITLVKCLWPCCPGQWHQRALQGFLQVALCKPIAEVSSKVLKLPLCAGFLFCQ